MVYIFHRLGEEALAFPDNIVKLFELTSIETV